MTLPRPNNLPGLVPGTRHTGRFGPQYIVIEAHEAVDEATKERQRAGCLLVQAHCYPDTLVAFDLRGDDIGTHFPSLLTAPSDQEASEAAALSGVLTDCFRYAMWAVGRESYYGSDSPELAFEVFARDSMVAQHNSFTPSSKEPTNG